MRVEPEHAHRPNDVLDALLAQIVKGNRQLVADLIADRPRNAEPARLAQALQTRGDVDAVAENISLLDDDIADVDADSENEPLVLGHVLSAPGSSLLHRDRAGHGVDRARELDQYPVARGFDDASAAGSDGRVDELTTTGPQHVQRADLVGAHQPAVTDDIRGQNGREPAFDRRLAHRHSRAAPTAFRYGPRQITLSSACRFSTLTARSARAKASGRAAGSSTRSP